MGYALPGPLGLDVLFSGVPINTNYYSPCYAGTPLTITARISESNIGLPSPIAGAVLTFSIRQGSTTVATGTAVSDGNGNAVWTWQNPAIGDYRLSVDWAGDAAHAAGGHTSNIPIGVVQYTNPPTPAPFNYAILLNWLTIAGVALLLFARWKR